MSTIRPRVTRKGEHFAVGSSVYQVIEFFQPMSPVTAGVGDVTWVSKSGRHFTAKYVGTNPYAKKNK